jgi:hypothetical protein
MLTAEFLHRAAAFNSGLLDDAETALAADQFLRDLEAEEDESESR